MAKSKGTLVEKRMKEWGVPVPTFAPIDDDVLVWRLPPLTTSPSGLLTIPEDQQSPHIKGLLLAMGPRAMDFLRSNGIEEGHVVIWRRWAGSEMHDHTKRKRLKSEILILKAKDIIGSDDLQKELQSGRAKYVQVNGRHCLQRKLVSGKTEKILALAASSTGPEADTARAIAEERLRKGA
jgi:co-chaperonin GroES (HSP10)